MIEPHELEKASWPELAHEWDNANHAEEDAKAGAVTIKNEMMVRLEKEKINSRVVEDFVISKGKRLSFADTPLEFAEQMGAIKKVKDDAELSTIKKSGADVPGAKETDYIRISRVKDEENTKEIQK